MTDPPIKRFAQRHTYLGTDAIAARDLGFAMAGRQQSGSSSLGSTTSLDKRTDSLLSLSSTSHMPPSQPPSKRPSSPDVKRREDSVKPDFGPPAKRPRPLSPGRDRDRDRFDGPPRRRFGSPAGWEKDRDRELQQIKRERELQDDKSSALPTVLSWFVGQLPNPGTFDGQWRTSAVTRGTVIDMGCLRLAFHRTNFQDRRFDDAVSQCCNPECHAKGNTAATRTTSWRYVINFESLLCFANSLDRWPPAPRLWPIPRTRRR